MKLGIWSVESNGIACNSTSAGQMFIACALLTRICISNGAKAYQCLLDILKYPSITEENLGQFNLVFMYAAGKCGFELEEDLLNHSINEQKRLVAAQKVELLMQKEKKRNRWL